VESDFTASQMAILEKSLGDVTLLQSDGAFLPDGVPTLRGRVDQLIAAGCTHVVLAMPTASRADATVLDVLIACRKRLLQHHGDLKIVAPPDFADYAAQQLGGWLRIHSSEREAVLAFWPIRAATGCLKRVGYWARGDEVSIYPNPRHLVRLDWRSQERARIVSYLQAGEVQMSSMGFSPCRFGCGSYGSSDLTDGVWCWPEGLAHYIEAHAVRLPDEFADTMVANRWRVPPASADWPSFTSDDFWIEWASGLGFIPASFGDRIRMRHETEVLLRNATMEQLGGLSVADSQRLRRVFEEGILDPSELENGLEAARVVLARFRALV
jgi:hypothetical protein